MVRRSRGVSKSGVNCLTDLYSDQEEADTRLVLHAIHLAESHSHVIVKCDDTDVLVLLVQAKGCLDPQKC